MIVTLRFTHVKDKDDLMLKIIRSLKIIEEEDRDLSSLVRIPLSHKGVQAYGEIQVRNG